MANRFVAATMVLIVSMISHPALAQNGQGTPRIPFPPLRGDQVVAFHRLRLLSAYHEISLLSFYEHASELSGLERLEPFCKSLTTVRLHRGSALGRAVTQSRSGLPFQVLYYNSHEFRDRLRGLVRERHGWPRESGAGPCTGTGPFRERPRALLAGEPRRLEDARLSLPPLQPRGRGQLDP